MNSNEVINWFDKLESVLAAGAKLRGLLEHASTIGLAREFVVTEVLRSILPEAVHIGTGRVVDQFGNSSKQIDIVVYDPRFPKLTVAGGALYMAEGVLATIEIKSCIDGDQLRGALDNCASVIALGIKGQFPEQAKARIDFYQSAHGLEYPEAVDMFHYMVRPATYIFSFKSKLTVKKTSETIMDWWVSKGKPSSPFLPHLPRLIATENFVAITNDGWINLEAQLVDSTLREDGSARRNVMSCFGTSLRFRWFAMHIAQTVTSRLGVTNFAENFDYSISDYFQSEFYLKGLGEHEAYFLRV